MNGEWKNGRTAFYHFRFAVRTPLNGGTVNDFGTVFLTSTVCVTAYSLYIHQTAQEYSFCSTYCLPPESVILHQDHSALNRQPGTGRTG